MLRRGDAGLLYRAAHRPAPPILGGDDILYRRPAAGWCGPVQGGVPADRHRGRRDRGGDPGADVRERAGGADHRARLVDEPVRLRVAVRSHAARLRLPARRLYRQHYRHTERRGAGDDLRYGDPARTGDRHRHRLREPDPRAGLPAHHHRAIAAADRCRARRCPALVARVARGRPRCGAGRRAAAGRVRRARSAHAVDPPAVRYRAAAAAGAHGARLPASGVAAPAAGQRGRGSAGGAQGLRRRRAGRGGRIGRPDRRLDRRWPGRSRPRHERRGADRRGDGARTRAARRRRLALAGADGAEPARPVERAGPGAQRLPRSARPDPFAEQPRPFAARLDPARGGRRTRAAPQ